MSFFDESYMVPPATSGGTTSSSTVYNVQASPYNAVGNGTTDDTAAIQSAINAASQATAGLGVVYFPPTGNGYRIATGLTLPSNVTLQGAGRYASYLLFDDVTNVGILAQGGVVRTDNLTANFGPDSRVAAIASAALSAYAVGNDIIFQDNQQTAYGGGTPGSVQWWTRVASVSTPVAGQFYTEERIPQGLLTSSTARVSLLSPVFGSEIRDIGLVVTGTPGTAANRSTAIELNYCRDIVIRNCRVVNFSSGGTGNPFWFNLSRGIRVDDVTFDRCLDPAASTGLSNTRMIDCYGVTDCTISRVIARRISGMFQATRSSYVTIDSCWGSGGAVPLVKPPVQAAPALASGGTLSSGTPYYYQITAVGTNGVAGTWPPVGETAGSNIQTITPSGGNLTVNLSWPYGGAGTPNINAEGYKVYRSTAANMSGSVLISGASPLTGATTTFSDTGIAGTVTAVPTISSTGSANDTWGNRAAKFFTANYHCKVTNCNFHDFDYTGIYIFDSSYCTVQGNNVYGGRDNGIHVDTSDGLTANWTKHNTVKGNMVVGVYGGDDGAGDLGSGQGYVIGGQYTNLEGNQCINANSPFAAVLIIGNDTRIVNNTVRNASGSSFVIGSGNAPARCLVDGNVTINTPGGFYSLWSHAAGGNYIGRNNFDRAPNLNAADAAVPSQNAALTYGTTVTPSAAAPWQTITVTNATAFTISAPTTPPASFQTASTTIEVFNNSGGVMGVITWNGAFVFPSAWTNPATSKRRYAKFDWNGIEWVCTSVAAADY